MISPQEHPARVPLAFAPMVGLVLVAANLRAAVSSVPEVIVDIRAELGWNDVALGALTTIPVLCMGVFALAVPAVSNRFGRGRTVAMADGPRHASVPPARDARSQPRRLAPRSAHAPGYSAASAKTVYDLGPAS